MHYPGERENCHLWGTATLCLPQVPGTPAEGFEPPTLYGFNKYILSLSATNYPTPMTAKLSPFFIDWGPLNNYWCLKDELLHLCS